MPAGISLVEKGDFKSVSEGIEHEPTYFAGSEGKGLGIPGYPLSEGIPFPGIITGGTDRGGREIMLSEVSAPEYQLDHPGSLFPIARVVKGKFGFG